MFDLASVGNVAPQLALHDAAEPLTRHRPRILAFVRAWTQGAEPTLRTRLAQLDCELVVVCDAGAWSLVRDREPRRCDRLDDEAELAMASYGVRGDALFVIDHRGVVRFAYRTEGALGASLADALDAAVEALGWRDHQSKLERIQWTPREWALKSLVVGCSLTFGATERRFARGTGPIAKLDPSKDFTR